MFRFDNYMETWAIKYKAISHVKEDLSKRRFFRVHDELRLDGFLQDFQYIDGPFPCCGIVTNIEGSTNIVKGIDYPVIKFLFLQYAGDENKKDFKKEADYIHDCYFHARKFLRYLQRDIKMAAQTIKTAHESELAHIRLDDVRIDTIGPLVNNWYCVIMTINAEEVSPDCYSEADYYP